MSRLSISRWTIDTSVLSTSNQTRIVSKGCKNISPIRMRISMQVGTK